MIIRSALRADADAIAKIYATYVTGGVATFEEEAPSADEIAERLAARPLLPWLVADDAGEVIGYAYAARYHARSAYRWTVIASVYLNPDRQRAGIGRLLYTRLFDELRSLGYVAVLGGITLPNDASVGLHEAMGFTPAGVLPGVGYKLGQWRDVGFWHLRIADLPDVPAEPREWAG